ncbi:unnamed protein product [Periconia digitata]|uniref:Uncharacterized protein n=1 Tax=Periconia digitata TaxID=1303443 RepID=A0A9W4ULH7_9PLEO|nr:unnamed protein product [Periconia digitata]
MNADSHFHDDPVEHGTQFEADAGADGFYTADFEAQRDSSPVPSFVNSVPPSDNDEGGDDEGSLYSPYGDLVPAYLQPQGITHSPSTAMNPQAPAFNPQGTPILQLQPIYQSVNAYHDYRPTSYPPWHHQTQPPPPPQAPSTNVHVHNYPATNTEPVQQQQTPKTLKLLPDEKPILFKVYYLPGPIRYDSVIHEQKKQLRFFHHPVLVVDYDQSKGQVDFYSLTSNPTQARREVGICLRLGDNHQNDGEDVLKLARDSVPMEVTTWVNLEQRFHIEWKHLEAWALDVRIDEEEIDKFNEKVDQLEASQNRFIYKPISRNLKWINPGAILMLANEGKSSSLGAPVLLVSKSDKFVQYLRIREIGGTLDIGKRVQGTKHHLRMKIGRSGEKAGPDEAPILWLKDMCQDMRQPSYVEGTTKKHWAHIDRFRTWTYPVINIQAGSMKRMKQYLAQHGY